MNYSKKINYSKKKKRRGLFVHLSCNYFVQEYFTFTSDEGNAHACPTLF